MINLQRQKTSISKHETKNFYLYILPWLLGFIVLTVYPMVYSFILSFTDMHISGEGKFVGIDNFTYAFNVDPLFTKALLNTCYYVVMFVPSSLVLAYFIAYLLSRRIKFQGFFRTVFYLPYVTAGVAVTILWGWIFNANFGLVNYALSLIGIKPVNWLGDPNNAMVSIVIMSLWTIGNTIIIFLAGIQDIPRSYYESASIDGANSLVQLFKITIPLTTPTIFFNLVVTIIAAFQIFQQPYILTLGGPLNSTYTTNMHLFTNGFEYGKLGYASTIGWIMLLIMMVITLLVIGSSKKWVFYDN
ncbi:MAG: sugar ABC transporter permease [Gallicola sp.]|nr:sugar ABC transporter permease [Gallicola sp.]